MFSVFLCVFIWRGVFRPMLVPSPLSKQPPPPSPSRVGTLWKLQYAEMLYVSCHCFHCSAHLCKTRQRELVKISVFSEALTLWTPIRVSQHNQNFKIPVVLRTFSLNMDLGHSTHPTGLQCRVLLSKNVPLVVDVFILLTGNLNFDIDCSWQHPTCWLFQAQPLVAWRKPFTIINPVLVKECLETAESLNTVPSKERLDCLAVI